MKEEEFGELTKNPVIRDFLFENKVFLNEDDFIKDLQNNNKNQNIYVSHQLSIDYSWSVLAKISSLLNLKNKHHLLPHIVFADTDIAGSEKSKIIKTDWLYFEKKNVSLLPKNRSMSEIRFSSIPKENFDTFIRALIHYFDKAPIRQEKINQLNNFYSLSNGELTHFNYLLSKEMINHYFHTEITYCLFHEIFLRKQNIFAEIFKEHIKYNEIFNKQAKILNQFAPSLKIKEKSQDELPFFITCPDDFCRNRLYAKKIETQLYGFSICKTCRKEITIHFEDLAIDNYTYLSPDFSLLLYLSDEYAGHVGGISSSLYVVIFNAIFKDLLNQPITPTYVPNTLILQKPPEFKNYDSLFYNFLML